MPTRLFRYASLALILASAPAVAQQNCEIRVSQSDGLASVVALAHAADWAGGQYTMTVSVRAGTNRSNSMQGGTVGGEPDETGAVALSRTVVSLPQGGAANIVVTLRKDGAESGCRTLITQ